MVGNLSGQAQALLAAVARFKLEQQDAHEAGEQAVRPFSHASLKNRHRTYELAPPVKRIQGYY
jgi:hypothetical protein